PSTATSYGLGFFSPAFDAASTLVTEGPAGSISSITPCVRSQTKKRPRDAESDVSPLRARPPATSVRQPLVSSRATLLVVLTSLSRTSSGLWGRGPPQVTVDSSGSTHPVAASPSANRSSGAPCRMRAEALTGSSQHVGARAAMLATRISLRRYAERLAV